MAWTFVGTAAAVAILGIAQRALGAEHIYGMTGVPATANQPFFGVFVNPNHAGALFAVAAPLAMSLAFRDRPLSRVLGGAGFIVCLIGVWAAGGRGAMLATAAGLAAALVVGAPRLLAQITLGGTVVAAGTALVVGLRTTATSLTSFLVPAQANPDAFSGRGEIWLDALRVVAGAPFIGVGPGGYDNASTWAKTSVRFIKEAHAHNEFLQAFAEYGVAGGIFWMLAVTMPVWLAFRACMEANRGRTRTLTAGWLGAAIALGVASLTDFPLRIGALSLLAAQVLGVLAATAGRDRAPLPAGPKTLFRGLVAVLGCGGLFSVLPPFLDRVAPASPYAPGLARLAEADEGRRQARDLTLLEMDDPAPWRATARRALSEALVATPLDAQPLARLGRLELEAGDAAAAADTFAAGTAAWSTLPWHWFGLAQAEAAAGDDAAAAAAWRRGLALNLPNNDKGAGWVARAFASQADPAATAGDVLPDRADRLRDGALILAKSGEKDAAVTLFARGVALDPRIGVSWANWELHWGDADGASDRVLAVPDRSCGTLRVAARATLAAGRLTDAIEMSSAALGTCSTNTQDLRRILILARALRGDGGVEAPLAALLAEDPSDVVLRRALLASLRVRSRWRDMAPHLQALVDAGAATPQEAADLTRARVGLPLR